MKVHVKTRLWLGDNPVIEKNMVGILKDRSLQFMEDNVKVFLNFSNSTMERRDLEKRISYQFIEKEKTSNEVFLYEFDKSVMIPIFTECFSYQETSLEIRYRLLLEECEVHYQVCWEEEK